MVKRAPSDYREESPEEISVGLIAMGIGTAIAFVVIGLASWVLSVVCPNLFEIFK